ncbi:MAG TPA: cupin domain-containing protein [Gemmatimonadota bacterium]|jgi:quercetin dioxygenase-like cupin family protein
MIRVATLLILLAALALPTAMLAQGTAAPVHAFVAPDAIQYEPFEVPGFASGIRLAVIHGDPTAASGAYTVRIAFPDGYRFPAHYHPKDENVTVLNGTFKLAMGTDESAPVETFTPGSYLYLPAQQPHFGSVEGETVLQLHGEAPFQIILANPGT